MKSVQLDSLLSYNGYNEQLELAIFFVLTGARYNRDNMSTKLTDLSL
jgi:hypothetical protein